MDISQTSAKHTPATSTPVGGARPKVRLSPEKVVCEADVKARSGEVTPEQSQSAESTQLQTQVSRKSEIHKLRLFETTYFPSAEYKQALSSHVDHHYIQSVVVTDGNKAA